MTDLGNWPRSLTSATLQLFTANFLSACSTKSILSLNSRLTCTAVVGPVDWSPAHQPKSPERRRIASADSPSQSKPRCFTLTMGILWAPAQVSATPGTMSNMSNPIQCTEDCTGLPLNFRTTGLTEGLRLAASCSSWRVYAANPHTDQSKRRTSI